MSAIAEELDRHLQNLDPERAAHYERLVRAIFARLEKEAAAGPIARRDFSSVTRTHDFGFKPGVDLSKLGQFADDC